MRKAKRAPFRQKCRVLHIHVYPFRNATQTHDAAREDREFSAIRATYSVGDRIIQNARDDFNNYFHTFFIVRICRALRAGMQRYVDKPRENGSKKLVK